MSRAPFIFALLVLIGCGGQPQEAAAPAAPVPAAEPAAPPAAPTAPEPAPVPAAEPEAAPSEPAPEKPVATSSVKTGEPTAAKKPEEDKPAAVAEKTPEAAPAAAAGPCGEEGQPMCPLQAFMDRFVQKPMDEGDLDAVAKGLTRAAKLAPTPAWNAGGADGWAGMAEVGAKAASAGDAAATKQSCKTCHKAFRSKYKAEFRTKSL